MSSAYDSSGQPIHRLEAEILDLALILHAEHGGGNNSTFVTRVASSSGTDTYSAIAAGVGALKGPSMAIANIKVMDMVEDLKANVSNWEKEEAVREYLVKLLNKKPLIAQVWVWNGACCLYPVRPRAVLLKQRQKSWRN